MRQFHVFSIFAGVFCTLLWLPAAIAQSANGTVAGTAKDSGGSLLHGARVRLDPVGKQAVTDNQGQFRITDVPPGDYTVTVADVGFEPFTKSVKVEGGQVTGVDAKLDVATLTDQILVTTERVQGEAEAINI